MDRQTRDTVELYKDYNMIGREFPAFRVEISTTKVAQQQVKNRQQSLRCSVVCFTCYALL